MVQVEEDGETGLKENTGRTGALPWLAEDRTHFGMWCIMSSPLLIGCDMTELQGETLDLLRNRELNNCKLRKYLAIGRVKVIRVGGKRSGFSSYICSC